MFVQSTIKTLSTVAGDALERPITSQISQDLAVLTTQSDLMQMTFDLAKTKGKRSIDGTNTSWEWNILGKRRVCAHKTGSAQEKQRRKTHFDVVTEIHRAEYDNVKRPIDPATRKAIEPAHKFEVTLESDSFSQSKYDLFLTYQTEIHHDGPRWRKGSFTSFLCNGMKRSTISSSGVLKKLGSFHQCYRLDGKLIAIGVLDLLPHGVSSVYLIYNPEFGDWDFGKLSALREIALAQELDYRYYYMGYYIHSCVKMRYKCSYSPQYVLDPDTLTWIRFDDKIRKSLDEKPFIVFSSKACGLESNETASTNQKSHEAVIASDEDRMGPKGNLDSSEDGEDSDEETQYPPGSLFNYRIPGVLTRDEVEAQCDLGHWKLHVRGTLVEMEDIVGWETMDITDPQSLKGIVGEFAATIGPKVVKHSAVALFPEED